MQTPPRRESGRAARPVRARPVSILGWTRDRGGREGGEVTTDLMTRARAGDGAAFRELTEPHRRELQVHCYRMLGSFQDAEDALQDTLLAAWRGLGGFEGRASIRTWLYRIATNRCLNALRSAGRRPAKEWDNPDVEPPEPTRLGEVVWLEPYPDALLEGAIDVPLGPEARYEQTEAISLAFVTALQVLPPASAPCSSCARCSGTTPTRWPPCSTRRSSRSTASSSGPAPPCSAACRRPAGANRLPLPAQPPSRPSWRSSSVPTTPATSTRWSPCSPPMPALDATDPPRVSRPRRGGPLPRQRRLARGRWYDLVPTRANGQLAFGVYLRAPSGGLRHGTGLDVLTLTGDADLRDHPLRQERAPVVRPAAVPPWRDADLTRPTEAGGRRRLAYGQGVVRGTCDPAFWPWGRSQPTSGGGRGRRCVQRHRRRAGRRGHLGRMGRRGSPAGMDPGHDGERLFGREAAHRAPAAATRRARSDRSRRPSGSVVARAARRREGRDRPGHPLPPRGRSRDP